MHCSPSAHICRASPILLNVLSAHGCSSDSYNVRSKTEEMCQCRPGKWGKGGSSCGRPMSWACCWLLPAVIPLAGEAPVSDARPPDAQAPGICLLQHCTNASDASGAGLLHGLFNTADRQCDVL